MSDKFQEYLQFLNLAALVIAISVGGVALGLILWFAF